MGSDLISANSEKYLEHDSNVEKRLNLWEKEYEY